MLPLPGWVTPDFMNNKHAAKNMTESQQAIWRPSLSETPRTLRIVPITGADAVEWTMVAIRCVSEGHSSSFGEGVEYGMRMIKDELLLPIGRDLPVREIIGCFSMATANRRATKLSRILHLVHTYPGAPLLYKGLRFDGVSLVGLRCFGAGRRGGKAAERPDRYFRSGRLVSPRLERCLRVTAAGLVGPARAVAFSAQIGNV